MTRVQAWLNASLLPGQASWWWLAWHLVGALCLIAVPAGWYLGTGLPALAPRDQIQLWAWATAYLALAASLFTDQLRGTAPRRWTLPLRVAVCFGTAWLILRYSADVPVSRGVLLVSAVMAGLLALAPTLLGTWVLPLGVVGMLGATAISIGRSEGALPADLPTPPITTERLVLAPRLYRGLVDSVEVDGGAIARWKDDLLLVTGEGEFYRLSFTPGDSSLASERLALTARFNRDKLSATGDTVFGPIGGPFEVRTTDVTVDTLVTPNQVYLAHNYWNAEARCQTMRVSRAALGDAPGTWETVYETTPCVLPSYELRRAGVGARLAWLGPRELALSVGDHAFGLDGGPSGPQDPASPYGKILRLGLDGRTSLISLGHRNPQGLVVTGGGRIWSTEHGPQGGDEINAIAEGGNYGWPLATYGVQYGQDRWPMAGDRRDHTGFSEPAQAFVPSIGISNLVEVPTTAFPEWGGDLLVSSLRGNALYRVRTHEDRVAFMEHIPVGYRIRDLEFASNGRLVLWLDTGVLMVLSRAPVELEGARLYSTCASCHGADLAGTPVGPPLRGVVGREIASVPGFPYSEGLKGHTGEKWTAERLDVFLQDPSKFAPGTKMVLEGMEQRTRFRIIEYMRDYRP